MDYRIQLALLAAIALSVITVVTAFLRGERKRAENRGVAPVGSVGEALRRVPFGGKVLILHLPSDGVGEAAEAATREPEVERALGVPEVRYVLLRAGADPEVSAHVFQKYAGEEPQGVSAVVLDHKGKKLTLAHAEGRPVADWLPGLLA